jgi:hypothetical protein
MLPFGEEPLGLLEIMLLIAAGCLSHVSLATCHQI